MERIFWIECPQCARRWYADWELRRSVHKLVCPQCEHQFAANDAPWIDDRERSR